MVCKSVELLVQTRLPVTNEVLFEMGLSDLFKWGFFKSASDDIELNICFSVRPSLARG